MGVVKANNKLIQNGPSTFALLVDDIKNMSESQQKLLWLQINIDKLCKFANDLDTAVPPHNLSSADIDLLIKEAKAHGRKKKKG